MLAWWLKLKEVERKIAVVELLLGRKSEKFYINICLCCVGGCEKRMPFFVLYNVIAFLICL